MVDPAAYVPEDVVLLLRIGAVDYVVPAVQKGVDQPVYRIYRSLAVVVKGEDDVAGRTGETRHLRGRLPEVAGKFKSPQVGRIIMAHLFDYLIYVIRRMVAHHYDLVFHLWALGNNRFYLRHNAFNRLFRPVTRNDKRYFHYFAPWLATVMPAMINMTPQMRHAFNDSPKSHPDSRTTRTKPKLVKG